MIPVDVTTPTTFLGRRANMAGSAPEAGELFSLDLTDGPETADTGSLDLVLEEDTALPEQEGVPPDLLAFFFPSLQPAETPEKSLVEDSTALGAPLTRSPSAPGIESAVDTIASTGAETGDPELPIAPEEALEMLEVQGDGATDQPPVDDGDPATDSPSSAPNSERQSRRDGQERRSHSDQPDQGTTTLQLTGEVDAVSPSGPAQSGGNVIVPTTTPPPFSGQNVDSLRPALVDGPVQPRDIARQMAISVAHDVDGVTEIALSPDDLGLVKLQMTTNDDRVVVVIAAERPETGDLLRRNLDSLAQEFRSAGYKDVSFSFSDQSSGNRTPDRQAVFPARADEIENDAPLDFIGAPRLRSLGLDLRV